MALVSPVLPIPILLARDRVRKPAPAPDQVEDKLFGIARWLFLYCDRERR
jgi:hypothetical protein